MRLRALVLVQIVADTDEVGCVSGGPDAHRDEMMEQVASRLDNGRTCEASHVEKFSQKYYGIQTSKQDTNTDSAAHTIG